MTKISDTEQQYADFAELRRRLAPSKVSPEQEAVLGEQQYADFAELRTRLRRRPTD